MKPDNADFKGWEYEKQGDYHRNLDPNWSYTPTYLRKVKHTDNWVLSHPKGSKVLDAGCGEGVLVEKYRNMGYDVTGVDLNYSGEFTIQADVRDLPFENDTFDLIMLLDVFEHLTFEDQPKVLIELARVLKPGGGFLVSIPNLAHLNSRYRMLFKGEVDRTDIDINHLGERPYIENFEVLNANGFQVNKTIGITLTLPFVYREIICKHAKRFRWLHDLLEPMALPSIAMINMFECTLRES